MIKPGLVSVTFRKLQAVDIVNLAVKANLQGIEWGGDIHVPHGQLKTARDVYKLTNENGLAIISYGSYYKVGVSRNSLPFESVLETALELNAPLIRVWSGEVGSDEISPEQRKFIIDDTFKIAEKVSKLNIRIAFEYHSKTLTDTVESTLLFLDEINRPEISMYWQTPYGMDQSNCLQSLKQILPYLSNFHVFNWTSEKERLSLELAMNEWLSYLKMITQNPKLHYGCIEFVPNDDPVIFLNEAKVFHSLLAQLKEE